MITTKYPFKCTECKARFNCSGYDSNLGITPVSCHRCRTREIIVITNDLTEKETRALNEYLR